VFEFTSAVGVMDEGMTHVTAVRTRSIADHPNYAKNLRKMLARSATVEDLNPAGPTLRIVGGVVEVENKFPDCVCVGGAGGYCCTGTLIGKNVVVTAGHCYPCIRLGTKVFVGLNISQPGKEYTGKVVRHPKYGQEGKHNDLCVIILDKDIEEAKPRECATSAEVEAADFARAVGYGTTDFAGTVGFGVRRYVDLPVVSARCGGETETTRYGCDADFELIAGIVGLNKDTCKGDSGGPIYVIVNGAWKWAGATSRATDEAPRVCGDGGIYVRGDKYLDWIKSLDGSRW
jgi:secreted trypsin-like serine protease